VHCAQWERTMVLPAAVVVADLNYLKRANDAHGHAAGDALLRQFAHCMRQQWPGATGYRMGGDEFLLVIEQADATALPAQIESLHARCAAAPLVLENGASVPVSAAIGYALRSDATQPLDHSVALADQQMYLVKTRQKKRSTDT